MQATYTRLYILLIFLVTLTIGNAQQMKDSIIHDSSFVIKEKPLDSYQGTFRNEKPYEGYFKKGDHDFFTVDYYEKGIPIYQYSVDLLTRIEQENLPLDLKSTYKDGKIIDGHKYTMYKHGLITKNLDNDTLSSFTQDIFAVHYYNRITFEKQNNSIVISNLKEKNYRIKLFLQNEAWVTQLLHQDQIFLHREEVGHTATNFPKNSEVSLYIKGSIKHGMAFRYAHSTPALFSDTEVNKNILDKLDLPKTKDINLAFEEILTSLIDSKGLYEEITIDERPLFMGYFSTDEDGLIKDGIRFIENKDNNIYHIYENGQSIKQESTNIKEFQQVLNDYFKSKR